MKIVITYTFVVFLWSEIEEFEVSWVCKLDAGNSTYLYNFNGWISWNVATWMLLEVLVPT
jgi:hypothetical protein